MDATEERYVVEIDFPGSPQRCAQALAAYQARLERVGDFAADPEIVFALPAASTTRASKTSAVLHLRWVDVPGFHARSAIAGAFSVLETMAPELVETSAVMARAYPQEVGSLVLKKRGEELGRD